MQMASSRIEGSRAREKRWAEARCVAEASASRLRRVLGGATFELIALVSYTARVRRLAVHRCLTRLAARVTHTTHTFQSEHSGLPDAVAAAELW